MNFNSHLVALNIVTAQPSQAKAWLGDTIIDKKKNNKKKPQTFYWSNSASSIVIGQWNINEIYETRLNKINSKL